ncbi:sugar kinase [Mesorhizobium sp.]|uniref:sugar kinase n=1 Tax=Mesorhizobium sp. TaxID=1871066 RepID=UPI000FE90E81|nr:sugar kinase [Mesorhizobium sp.]RWI87907.1 MAG: sugar kinase [Mesorhizobium sp.]
MKRRALFVGEAMVELSLAPDGATASIGVAGDVLNAAVYCRAGLGDNWQVAFVSAVGVDSFSNRIQHFAEEHRIDCSGLKCDPSRECGLYAIELKASGERSFNYWRSESAARYMFGVVAPGDFSVLAGADLIFYSAITLAILPQEIRIGFLEAIACARNAGCLIAFDSNYRLRLWESSEIARRTIRQAWETCDIGFPSVDDEMALNGEGREEVKARFAALGLQLCILKEGENGPAILSPVEGGDSIIWPKASEVVDTTGAGDAFDGAALGAWLETADSKAAAAAGHSTARKVVGIRGAIAPFLNRRTVPDSRKR